MDCLPVSGSGNRSTRIDVIYVEKCRNCSSAYEFELSHNIKVSVICGRPSESEKYKAVSYLWQRQNDERINLICRHCMAEKLVPMRDTTKLSKILGLVSGQTKSCNIWLDALSIDQDNIEDKNAQLRIMGEIYRHADVVSVLLPVGDEEAYSKLKDLASIAQEVVDFEKSSKVVETGVVKSEAQLDLLSNLYSDRLGSWMKHLHRWLYFRRAWTFQEWTMASELEITCEASSHKEIMYEIKNIILMAGTVIGLWKMTRARKSGIPSTTMEKLLQTRDENGLFLNQVRLFFPFSDAYIADNELTGDTQRRHTFLQTAGAIDSGTFVTVKSPREQPLGMQAMLSLALNAFTMSERTAFYAADIVECWASMCNIQYDYISTDSTELTLHKVLCALRSTGLQFYNWHANTAGSVTDMTFTRYAAAMRQSNSESNGFMLGSPVFVGRADTFTHVKMCIEQTDFRYDFKTDIKIQLREVCGAMVKHATQLQERFETVEQFRSLIAGDPNKDRLMDVTDLIEEMFHKTPTEILAKHILLVVTITVQDDPTMDSFDAWAICPSGTKINEIYVARESLNGTLVVAERNAKQQTPPDIVAYLLTSHQRDGTYLIKSDEHGVVDIIFRQVQQPVFPLVDLSWLQSLRDDAFGPGDLDLGIVDAVSDRMLDVRIALNT